MDADRMQVTEQIKSNKSLESGLLLIYTFSNLFSSLMFQNELCFLEIYVSDQNPQSEDWSRLSYFPTGTIGGF
ncbi:MAG: hypothetical protein ACFFAJ_05085 [Candidatus Hodarchaeota archaeon]